MNDDHSEIDRDNEVPASPNMIVELVIPATAVVAGGKLAYDITRDYRGAFKPKDPIEVMVLNGRTTADRHELIIELENRGVHGVFIESFKQIKPVEAAVEVKIHAASTFKDGAFSQGRIGVHNDKEDLTREENALPLFFARHQKRLVRVVLPKMEDRQLREKPYGELRFTYLVLGIAQIPTDHLIEFSVPKAGWTTLEPD